MKLFNRLAVTYTVCLLVIHVAGEQKGKTKKSNDRFSRQLKNNNNADQMVQNILRWLQDVYGQQSRTIRQGSLREYLPPTISQKPRPFEPRPIDNGGGVDENGNFVDTGYPPAGSVTPQPPFTIYTNPATGGITGIGAPGIPGEDLSTGPGSSPKIPSETEGSSSSPGVINQDQDGEYFPDSEIASGTTFLPSTTDSSGFQGNQTYLPGVTEGTESSVGPESPSQSTDLPPVVTDVSGTESPSGPDVTEGPEPDISPESTDLPSITDNTESPDTPTDLPKVTGSEQGTESSVGPESPSESTNLPPVVTEGSGTEPPSGPDVTEGPEPEISPESTDLPSITDNSGSPDTATDLPKATGSEQGTESSVGPESPSESTDISPIVTEGSGTESPSGPDVTERPGAPFEIPDVTEKEPDVESSEEPEIPPGTSDLPPITTEGSGTPEVPEDDKGTKSPLEPELPQGYTYLPPLTDSTQVPGTESSVSPESSSDSTDLPPVVTEGSGTESSVSPDVTKGPQPEISPESTDIPSITDNTGSPDTATDLPKVTGSEQGTESSVGPESPSESTDLPPVVTEGSGTEPPSVPDVTQGPEPEISPEYTDLPSITGSTGSSDTATDLPKVTGSEQGTESPAESTNIPPVVTEGSGTESPSGPEVTEGPDVTEKEPDVQPSEVPEISHESTALPSITDSTGPPDAPTDLPEVTVSDKGTEPTFGIEPPSGTTYFPPLPMFTEGILTIIPDENRGVQGTGSPTVPPYEPGVPSKTTYYAPSDSTVRPENPTLAPGVPETSTYYPTRPPYQPGLPSETTYFTDRPTQPPALPAVTDQAQYPDNNQSPGIPEGTSGYTPAQEPGYPTSSPSGFTGYPTSPPSGFTGYPTSPSGYTSNAPSGFSTTRPVNGETVGPSETETSNEKATTSQPIEVAGETEGATPGISSESPVTPGPSEEQPSGSTEVPSKTTVGQPEGIPTDQTTIQDTGVKVNPDDDDLKHPPHIHALDVQCAKDMMTINIEFNREFNGVIYSKGYYNMPECRYVNENSGQTKYTFTVNLNMCGTEFVNAFDTEGRSYLENILVLQNEIGIQEVWDTVRSVRCLWEGNLKEQLSVTLMVGMLSQEIVTFSGDTAMAKLDVVLGRGPFGQPASGLVKIGEQMTLVVSVSGDPGFDVQVKDCRATDSSGSNIIPLTDDNGCILKPKLFGSFQKTRNTGETGASIIAYAYFNAFKFPDVMDIMIECNIELCKTDCEMCPDANPQLEPAKRRKRDITIGNETLHDSVLMAKHLRIVLPDDLASAMDIVQHDGVCMSTQSFVYSTTILISLLTASCLLSAYLWFTSHKQKSIQF